MSPAAGAIGCENCGAELAGRFCHLCGAPQVSHNDRSLRHLAAEAVEELTSVDRSRFLRTLATLLFKPGALTRAYFSGRRVRYLKPLTLCLSLLALHLYAYSASKTVSMYDIGKLTRMVQDSARAKKVKTPNPMTVLIERAAAREKVPVRMIEKEIDERWARNASLLQIPLIILFTFVLQLAYLSSGRFAAEHFVFSMHFISFQVAVQLLLWPLYYVFGISLSPVGIALSVLDFAVDVAYLLMAQHNFYKEPFRKAAIRAPLIYGGYVVIYILIYYAGMILAAASTIAAAAHP